MFLIIYIYIIYYNNKECIIFKYYLKHITFEYKLILSVKQTRKTQEKNEKEGKREE